MSPRVSQKSEVVVCTETLSWAGERGIGPGGGDMGGDASVGAVSELR